MTALATLAGWLSGSAPGRWLAAVLLAVAALGVIAWRLIATGAARERARATQATLNTVATRVRVDEDLARLSARERADRLRQWARRN